jgi:hypothetical protein
MSNLKIDLGCGSCKKQETIGIDIQPYPGVDYVLDLQTESLPFPDQSVAYVYSSHFLEHLVDLSNVFFEISRVCVDGAKVELWTPYAWSNSAFIYDHKLFLNEDHYLHMCVWFPEHWEKILKARWLLKEFVYVIEPDVLTEIYRNNVSLDFAIKYYKGIVKEFGVFIEVCHEYEGSTVQPQRTFAFDRSAERQPIKPDSQKNVNPDTLNNAIKWFSLTAEQEQSQPQLWHAQVKIEQLQYQLQQTQAELLAAQTTIATIQTSKFWKLRTAWLNLKRAMGRATDG